MKINNKEFLNPQQQLYQNTKDIEELKTKVMEWYLSYALLAYTDTSVAREDTNVPLGVKSGFLMTETAMIFRIVGGDDETLLIEYWAAVGGHQGSGPQLI